MELTPRLGLKIPGTDGNEVFDWQSFLRDNFLTLDSQLEVLFPYHVVDDGDSDTLIIDTTDRTEISITNTHSSGGTNSIVLSSPVNEYGRILVLTCLDLTSGNFTLIESTSAILDSLYSDVWTPAEGDTLTLVANGNKWLELTRTV